MTKVFFQENPSSNEGEKLFATEYLAANKRELDREFSVTEIMAAKSGKGYMVHTEHFVCWLWRKSKITIMLLEALQAYVETGTGFHLFVTLTNKNKDCFLIGCNTDISAKWYDLGNGLYSLTPKELSSTEGENPFLPSALSPLIGKEDTEEEEIVTPIRRKRAS